MQDKSLGDKGIKIVGVFSLITCSVIVTSHAYIHYWFFSIGAGYLYFATKKYKTDKAAGQSIDRVRSFIIIGGVLIVFGIIMTIGILNGYLD